MKNQFFLSFLCILVTISKCGDPVDPNDPAADPTPLGPEYVDRSNETVISTPITVNNEPHPVFFIIMNIGSSCGPSYKKNGNSGRSNRRVSLRRYLKEANGDLS